MSAPLHDLLRLNRQAMGLSSKIPCFISVFEKFRQNREGWVHQSALSNFLEKAMLRVCEDITALEISGFSEAIIQSCLSANLNMADGAVRFRIRDEISSLKDFINAIAAFIEVFTASKSIESNFAEELRNFAARYNNNDNFIGEDVSPISDQGGPVRACTAVDQISFPRQEQVPTYPVGDRSGYPSLNSSSPRNAFVDRRLSQQIQMPNQSFGTSHSSLFSSVDASDYERAELLNATRSRPGLRATDNLTRLLAQVRKQGMDILFPQNTHDKVLACIFVAVRSKTALAHRELIDLVMLVRDSGKVSQLEAVTKTKIRGVLALLKHADVLSTHGLEGTPVQLALHPYIRTFEELRNNHDNFIQGFACKNKISCSRLQWQDVLWTFPTDVKACRCATITDFCSQLVAFYQDSSWMAVQNSVLMPGLSHSPVGTHSVPSYAPSLIPPENFARVDLQGDEGLTYPSDKKQPLSAPPASEGSTSREGTPTNSNDHSPERSSSPTNQSTAVSGESAAPAPSNGAEGYGQTSAPIVPPPSMGNGSPSPFMPSNMPKPYSPSSSSHLNSPNSARHNSKTFSINTTKLAGYPPHFTGVPSYQSNHSVRTDSRPQLWSSQAQVEMQRGHQQYHHSPSHSPLHSPIHSPHSQHIPRGQGGNTAFFGSPKAYLSPQHSPRIGMHHQQHQQQQHSGMSSQFDFHQPVGNSNMVYVGGGVPHVGLRRSASDGEVFVGPPGMRSNTSNDSLHLNPGQHKFSHPISSGAFSHPESRPMLWGGGDIGRSGHGNNSVSMMNSSELPRKDSALSKSMDYSLFSGSHTGARTDSSGYFNDRARPPSLDMHSYSWSEAETSELDSQGNMPTLPSWTHADSPSPSCKPESPQLPHFFSSSPIKDSFLGCLEDSYESKNNTDVDSAETSMYTLSLDASARSFMPSSFDNLTRENTETDNDDATLSELIDHLRRPYSDGQTGLSSPLEGTCTQEN